MHPDKQQDCGAHRDRRPDEFVRERNATRTRHDKQGIQDFRKENTMMSGEYAIVDLEGRHIPK